MKSLLRYALVGVLGFAVTACTERQTGPVASVSGVLQLWVPQGPLGDHVLAASREFNAQNQTSIRVVAFPDVATLTAKQTEMMAQGRGADAIIAPAEWIAAHHDMVYFLAEDATLTPSKFQTDFAISAQDALLDGGNIYGVPLAVDTLALYWNQDHIINRLPDANTPPATWSGITGAIPQLTKTDTATGTLRTAGAAFGTTANVTRRVDLLLNLMAQGGVDFFTADGLSPAFGGTYSATNAPAAAALELLSRFTSPQYKVYTWSEDFAQDYESFARGRVSMVVGRAADFATIQDLIQKSPANSIALSDVRVSPLPQSDANADPVVLGHVTAATVLRSADSKAVADLGWAFLKYMASEDQQRSLQTMTQLPSAHISVQRETQSNPQMGVFTRQAKVAQFVPLPISAAAWHDDWANVLDALTLRTITPTGAVSQYAQQIKEQLRVNAELDRKIRDAEPTPTTAQ